MKKIKLLAYVLIASITILSCRDAVDIVQDGELTEEAAIRNVNDLRGFLNGNVYSSLNTANEIWLGSVFTDETGIAPSNSGWYFSEFKYILNSDNGYVTGTWGAHYGAINRANRLLKIAERITPAAGEETQRYNSILAEARTVRAFAYLQLESYFTTDMKDDAALGVIKLDGVPDLNAQLPRSTNGEIFAQIESDLTFAENNLWETDPLNPVLAANKHKFVSKNMINAIRARMYAYRGKYAQAKQYAQAVVSGGPALSLGAPYSAANFYTSSTTNPYRKIWADIEPGEIIFALSRPSAGGADIARFWTTNSTNINGSLLLQMGMNLFNLYQSWDIRGKAFVDPTSTATVKVIDKYPGKGNTALRNDIKVFRASEMYFILAEAAVAEGDLVTAGNYLRTVRSARRYLNVTIPTPNYANAQAAWQDILKERRIELAYEGHRYVDLRRLGAVAGVSIDRNAADDGGAGLNAPLTLPITDHRFTFPIPAAEKLGNPSIVQNPGY